MIKARNKKISLLLTIVFLFTIMVPLVGPAAAASTYSVSNVKVLSPDVKGGAAQSVGSITVRIDAGSVTSAAYRSKVALELPSDYDWGTPTISVPGDGIDDYGYNDNSAFTVTKPQSNRLEITINRAPDNSLEEAVFILEDINLLIPSGASNGAVKVKAIASSSSVFSNAEFDLLTLGTSAVYVSCSPDVLGPDGDYVTLYVKEGSKGSMKADDVSLKFTLPSGFTWADPSGTKAATVDMYWNAGSAQTGSAVVARLDRDNDNRTLIIDNNPAILDGSYFKLKAYVNVDETTANAGDVEVSVGGKSDYEPSDLIVAKYGDYGIQMTAESTPDVLAGKYGEKIGKIVIQEDLKGSLVPNRTVSLTLPVGAKWAAVPAFDSANSDKDNLGTVQFQAISSDARTIKYTVAFSGGATGTEDAAKLVFKDGKVVTAADFTGPLTCEVTGSLGLNEDLQVANVIPAVTATVANKKDFKIGVAKQEIGDIVIEEAAKEVIATKSYEMDVNNTNPGLVTDLSAYEDGYIEIVAPSGVTFEGMPKITVDGNLKLDATTENATITADRTVIKIPVNSTSTKPATVTVSGIKLNVDRTVVEGDLKLMIGGSALVDDIKANSDYRLFEPERYAASVLVGQVITPAPNDTAKTVSFTAGQAGVYIENGRTMVQVNMLDELGVTKAWDATAKIAYFFNGAKVVAFPIGKAQVIVQGAATVTLEAPNKIIDGNTYVALRGLEYLGVQLGWDDATKTATATLK